MSKKFEQQILKMMLRDSDGKPQEILSNLEQNEDGSKSFVVGRRDTGECYRHTIKTDFVEYKDGEFSDVS